MSTYSIRRVGHSYEVIENETLEIMTKAPVSKRQAIDIANELFYYCVTHKAYYNL